MATGTRRCSVLGRPITVYATAIRHYLVTAARRQNSHHDCLRKPETPRLPLAETHFSHGRPSPFATDSRH